MNWFCGVASALCVGAAAHNHASDDWQLAVLSLWSIYGEINEEGNLVTPVYSSFLFVFTRVRMCADLQGFKVWSNREMELFKIGKKCKQWDSSACCDFQVSVSWFEKKITETIGWQERWKSIYKLMEDLNDQKEKKVKTESSFEALVLKISGWFGVTGLLQQIIL